MTSRKPRLSRWCPVLNRRDLSVPDVSVELLLQICSAIDRVEAIREQIDVTSDPACWPTANLTMSSERDQLKVPACRGATSQCRLMTN
jgi:hypothetical protein